MNVSLCFVTRKLAVNVISLNPRNDTSNQTQSFEAPAVAPQSTVRSRATLIDLISVHPVW